MYIFLVLFEGRGVTGEGREWGSILLGLGGRLNGGKRSEEWT